MTSKDPSQFPAIFPYFPSQSNLLILEGFHNFLVLQLQTAPTFSSLSLMTLVFPWGKKKRERELPYLPNSKLDNLALSVLFSLFIAIYELSLLFKAKLPVHTIDYISSHLSEVFVPPKIYLFPCIFKVWHLAKSLFLNQ